MVCHWSIGDFSYHVIGVVLGPADLFDALLERCRKMQTAWLHTLVLWLFCSAYAWNLLMLSSREALKLDFDFNPNTADGHHEHAHVD